MFYNKEELERLRKQGEEDLKKMEQQAKGHRYESSAGIEINCLHCKHDHFHRGKALLNTRGFTFFDLDWLNEDATTLLCNQCGYIHWFGKEVKQL
jgi:predicted nucleic-acid-binding Zn-ribbon protein